MIWNVCFYKCLDLLLTALIACFTPCVFNFEWCNWVVYQLLTDIWPVITCIHHWLKAFTAHTDRGFCSEIEVNGCLKVQCPCSVFRTLWFLELVCNSNSFSYISNYIPPVCYPSTNKCTHLPFLHFSGQCSFLGAIMIFSCLSHFLKQFYCSWVIDVSVVFLQMFKHLMLSSHKYFCERIVRISVQVHSLSLQSHCAFVSSWKLLSSFPPLVLCFTVSET